jgi:hypothetical protein
VNALLEAGEPGNVSTDEHAGYTGYKPQSVIDALNEVMWGEWGFEEISNEIIAGEKGGIAVAQVRVQLKGVDFQPTGYGQNRVTRGDIGDARKGAQTDAIKKTLSYFSIGNRAYHGLLSADKPAQRSQGNTGRVQAVQSKPTRIDAGKSTVQSVPSLKDRLNNAYDRALALSLIEKGKTSEESGIKFLKWAAGVLGDIQLTNSNQLNAQRLDTIEAYLNSQDAA